MFGIPKGFKAKNEIWYFLISILLVHIAAYFIVPILPLLLKNSKHLKAPEIGIVIGAGSLFIQLGSIIAGLLSDRVGNKFTMLLSHLCQALGLIGMGFSRGYFALVFFSALNGVGTGIYIPSTKAALTYIASENQRTTVFSLRSVSSHVGICISGIILLLTASTINFYMAAGIYILLLIFSWRLLPNDCGDQPCPALPLKRYMEIFSDKPFMVFTGISALIWGLHTQLSFLLPLRAEAINVNTGRIGLIWTTTSIMVILTQSLISKGFLEKHPLSLSMLLGTLLVGSGIILLGWSSSFMFLILCSLIFIVGEMFMMPAIDSYNSSLANQQLIGAYFAVANLAAGIGAAAGAFSSGWILDIYTIAASTIPWLIYSGYTAVVSIFIIILLKPFKRTSGLK